MNKENTCDFCLELKETLTSTHEFDRDDIKIVDKLTFCCPELNWIGDHFICRTCSQSLSTAYDFRQLCLNSFKSDGNESFQGNSFADESFDVVKHDFDDLFICYDCNGSFKLKEDLIEHIESEHAVKFKCDKFPTEELVNAPTLDYCGDAIVRKEDAYACNVCGNKFATKHLVRRHLKNVHTTEKLFECDVCSQRFASKVYLLAHKRYHLRERNHICSFCGKGFITKSDLYHHEKIHANKRAYKCDRCSKAFNTSSDLRKHTICVHVDRDEWKYVCGYCSRRFPLKTNLDSHVKTHTGERNFACHLCEKRCINRSVLLRHVESHSNVRSFKCVNCDQEYKYRKSLDIHLVKAHGIGDAKVPVREKKFFCHVCPKSYYAKNKLEKHIRTHTGERPFKCDLCSKCFIDKSYVKQHMKIHHNLN